MSQKTEEIESVFNPSNFGVFYYNVFEIEVADQKKQEAENKLYEEVRKGLKSDLVSLGFEPTYSSEILIGEVALNIILMNRLKTEMMCKDPLRESKVLKPQRIYNKKEFECPRESVKSIIYDLKYLENKEIDPLFDKLIPQLQKQIKDGLKVLGLLPVQQIERQKMTIVKKLRQRYENLQEEVAIKATKEKNKFSNRKEVPNDKQIVEQEPKIS